MSDFKDTKTFSINDILTWKENGELTLSPKYQRNKVWTPNAKSYLIDSIIRGYPIPQIFIRQNIDINTRKTTREVIDGQQRITTIIEFIDDIFAIQKSHNKDYAGYFYNQLPDDVKEAILNYNISFEIIKIKDDAKIYEMFARLNTNNVVLNRQELRNAQYWGEFKVFIYRKASEYRYLFSEKRIFKDKEFSRMIDVEFISSLVLVLLEGITTDSQPKFDNLYKKYDKEFNELEDIENKFNKIFSVIEKIFYAPMFNSKIFYRKTYFYTLFSAIYHNLFNNLGGNFDRNPLFTIDNIDNNMEILQHKISSFESEFLIAEDEKFKSNVTFAEFEKFHRTRTTSKEERIQRVKILCEYLAK